MAEERDVGASNGTVSGGSKIVTSFHATPSVEELERALQRAHDALTEISRLAGWQTDDDANEDDVSPEDMTAHVDGLIRRQCRVGLGLLELNLDTSRQA